MQDPVRYIDIMTFKSSCIFVLDEIVSRNKSHYIVISSQKIKYFHYCWPYVVWCSSMLNIRISDQWKEYEFSFGCYDFCFINHSSFVSFVFFFVKHKIGSLSKLQNVDQNFSIKESFVSWTKNVKILPFHSDKFLEFLYFFRGLKFSILRIFFSLIFSIFSSLSFLLFFYSFHFLIFFYSNFSWLQIFYSSIFIIFPFQIFPDIQFSTHFPSLFFVLIYSLILFDENVDFLSISTFSIETFRDIKFSIHQFFPFLLFFI